MEINVTEAIDETDYLTMTQANRDHIATSINALEEGKGVTMTVEELQRKFLP